MTCEEALELISGHIDQENTPEEETLLQAHLEECDQCREVMRAFLELEGEISQLEEPPADLRDSVMATIRAEAPTTKKKTAKRWGGIAVAAALVAVIGISSIGLPVKQTQPAGEAAPMLARSMPQPMKETAVYSSAETPMEYAVADTASAPVEISPQDLADERQADVAVTYELLPEMEVCPCETLENGALLYVLETTDGAVNLSRIYGAELYQPTAYNGSCSYALLLPQN